MTRDQLERQVWRQLRSLGAERHPQAVAAVERILRAADDYADFGDTPRRQAERRDTLELATFRPRKAAS